MFACFSTLVITDLQVMIPSLHQLQRSKGETAVPGCSLTHKTLLWVILYSLYIGRNVYLTRTLKTYWNTSVAFKTKLSESLLVHMKETSKYKPDIKTQNLNFVIETI